VVLREGYAPSKKSLRAKKLGARANGEVQVSPVDRVPPGAAEEYHGKIQRFKLVRVPLRRIRSNSLARRETVNGPETADGLFSAAC